MTPRDLYFTETKGFRHGAALHAMEPIEDKELAEAYERGWIAGQEARRAHHAECAKRTGYTPTIIRAMNHDENPEKAH